MAKEFSSNNVILIEICIIFYYEKITYCAKNSGKT